MAPSRPLVVFGLLGTTLDSAGAPRGHRAPKGRWEKWRPTIDLCRQPDMVVSRLELLHQPADAALAGVVAADIAVVSPETTVRRHVVSMENPWDFEEVYGALDDFVGAYAFDDDVDYAVHITTGTHTAQICWFLLAESRRLPAKLLQTGPPRRLAPGVPPPSIGTLDVIDLDLARYDKLSQRFAREADKGVAALGGGVVSADPVMGALLSELETVATRSTSPVLLLGETGVGKTQMARRLYALKKHKHLVTGPLVEVNCATLRGDAAMSTLFGHKKGSYTGAISDRVGMLKKADGGVLFLDEIGELGLDEQAMLLKAIEDKRFTPMGADVEVTSDFQLVCGTHRDLDERCRQGRFREDLKSRLDVWRFMISPLRQRHADIADNVDVELRRAGATRGLQLRFTPTARSRYLAFATSTTARWPGNFRELSASVQRMGTLCDNGRIDDAVVSREITRLQAAWTTVTPTTAATSTTATVDDELGVGAIDDFDAVQLRHVLEVCRRHHSLADAGRALFAVSRLQKRSRNDTDRLRKYLTSWRIDPDAAVGRAPVGG